MGTVTLRLAGFVTTRFFPPVYAGYGVLWALALESFVDLTRDERFVPSGATVLRAVTVVAVLLYARMLDDQKDLPHDRVHHPDRPLATGAITATELRISMAVLGTVVIGLNLLCAPAGAAAVAAVLGYGLVTAALERRWARARDGMLTGLALSYPAQLLLTAYLYESLVSGGGVRWTWRFIAVAAVFAGAFLQFELVRKTSWRSGSRLYSNALGPVPAALAGLGSAALASLLVAALCAGHSPAAWLLILPLALPAAGTARFLSRRAGAAPRGPAMAFILGLYATLIVLGVLSPAAEGR